ncbi:hypothetical protein NX722_11420 [Endozoicomonas gorgoniicola]|uniref:Uncharacterized protein n=1 Tax=Endozoicomonas gorgoniicola TaxID=1234144 RepID=A0ABT3MV21_9GAMM|nr:hypothetical protein [Endozoicomonas gorgoniicola]MCW7553237.1 hypothetical protein [Endozoicomonas gorgoniicola]
MPDAIHQKTIDQKMSCQKNRHKWIAAGSLLTVMLSALYAFSSSSGNELPPSPSTTENRALVSIVSTKPGTYRYSPSSACVGTIWLGGRLKL